MVRWREDEARLSRQRRVFAVGGARGNGGRGGGTGGVEQTPTKGVGGGGATGGSRKEIAVDERRKEMTDRVARHQADYSSK